MADVAVSSTSPFAKAVSGAALDAMTFRPASYLVDRLLPRGGIALLAGAPKLGKSYLAISLALAVAQNGKALGALPVSACGPVLLISLDDASLARAQSRLRAVNADAPLPPNLTVMVDPIGRGDDARNAIGRYLADDGRDTSLIILDTLSHVRGRREPNESIYDGDVRFMGSLRRIVARYPDVTILCLVHTRKEYSLDGLQAVSGSYGITGGADTVLTLSGNRFAPGRLLEVFERDGPGGEYALRFTGPDGLAWTNADPHSPDLMLVPKDAAIYRALCDFGGPVSAADLLAAFPDLGTDGRSRLADDLMRLAKRGIIRRTARGTYAI